VDLDAFEEQLLQALDDRALKEQLVEFIANDGDGPTQRSGHSMGAWQVARCVAAAAGG